MTLALLTPLKGGAQTNQCWTNVNGVWVYNPACSQSSSAPLKVAVGKYLTVNNILTLSGTDNATLNVGQGGTLGSAAFASATQFQPAGGGGNSSAYYGGALTIGTGTDYINIYVSPGLAFSSSMWVLCAYVSNPTQFMYGYVDTYNSTTGQLKITVPATGSTGGSGNQYVGWNISVAGAIGPVGASGTSGSAIRSIEAFGGTTLPPNYLWCDGTQYACSGSYNTLCNALGSTWGGNGTTTFNVPNLHGRILIASGQGYTAQGGGLGTNRSFGTIGGAETNAAFSSSTSSYLNSNPVFSGTQQTWPLNMTSDGANYYAISEIGYGVALPDTGNVTVTPAGTVSAPGITSSTSTAASVFNMMNPFAVVNYIIRYQ